VSVSSRCGFAALIAILSTLFFAAPIAARGDARPPATDTTTLPPPAANPPASAAPPDSSVGTPSTPTSPPEGNAQAPVAPPEATTPALPTTQTETVVSEDAAAGDSVVLENADSLSQTEAHRWVARGNVRARYRDNVLAADRLDLDTDAQTALFTGNVVLHAANGETVHGGPNGALQVDLSHDTYEIDDASTSIPPSALRVGILQPIVVYGGTIHGRRGFIDARGGRFTTCDFPDPHYWFQAADVSVIPDKRLIAKRVTLYRRHHALFTWPYIYVPLDRRFVRQTLIPQVGQSQLEGYYAKFAIGYLLAKNLPGILRIDAMQKKGVGTGIDQSYGDPRRPRRGSGDVALYQLHDQSTGAFNVTGTLNHTQRFGTVNVALNSQFQSNSYQASASSSNAYSTQFSLARTVGNLTDTINANFTTSDYGVGSSQMLTSSFNQTFRPTTAETLTTRFDYSSFLTNYTGTGRVRNGSVTSNLEYDERDRLFDWKLVGTKYDRLYSGSQANFFGGLQRLPELQLNTDPQRFDLLRHFLPAPGRVSLDMGVFSEPTSHTQDNRIEFNVNTGSNTHTLAGRTYYVYMGAYDQRFYGDGAAQYVLSNQNSLGYKIGSRSTAAVSYNYLRPYGFTPFQFDFSGSTNLAALNVSYQDNPHLQTTVSTGYDFNAASQSAFGRPTPWQNLSVQTLFRPSKNFGNRLTTTYDFNQGRFLDATDNFVVSGRDGFRFSVGTRYAPLQRKFANINGVLDLPIVLDRRQQAGYRIQAIASYNGFTRQYEYKGLALTRAWHDWEATVTYQDSTLGVQPGPMISFNLNLKAFPTYQPFATGQFGQAIDTGLGTVF